MLAEGALEGGYRIRNSYSLDRRRGHEERCDLLNCEHRRGRRLIDRSPCLGVGGVWVYKSHPLVAIWPRKHNNDVNCSECESQTIAVVVQKQKQVLPEQYSWDTQCFNREKDGISVKQLLCAQKCLPD